MARFLHTADWQIGRQYGQLPAEDAVALAEARFAVIERIAALAAGQGVDAVLVAGDVFDAQTVSDRAIRRTFNAMEAFDGPWIFIPGNHDAALAESVWSRAKRLNAVPSKAHLALEPAVLDFTSLGFVVLAAPLTQRHTHVDLTDWFADAHTAPGLLRIGLAHGSVQGVLADEIDSANPIAAGRAEQASLDYLALGDWHGTKQIDTRTWYSGTPEQERFKDNGAGHALLVSIDGPGAIPQVTAQVVGQYAWHELTVHLNVPSDAEGLISLLALFTATDVLRLEITGQTDLAARERINAALSAAEGRTRCLDLDATQLRLIPTDDDIAALNADGYLGGVISDLRERQHGDAPEVASEALAILASMLNARQQGAPA